MTFFVDISNAAKYSLDVGYAQPARLGLHPYSITAVVITNSGGVRPGVGGTRIRTETRILSFDGYEFNAGVDGYLNPSFEQVVFGSKDIILSAGILTDKDYRIGPIVYPYHYSGITGGVDFSITNPVYDDSKNIQLYFHVIGPAYPNGQYFKRIWSKEDSNLAYYLYIRSTAEKPA